MSQKITVRRLKLQS